jgi:hypothetical protein
MAHDVEILSRSQIESGEAFNGEIDFVPLAHVLYGEIYPDIGASYATGGGTSYAYADLKYEYKLPGGLFFDLGVGAAVHNGDLGYTADHKALGSRVLFHVPLELGYAFTDHVRASIYYEHISNAYLASPNEGLDNIGLRLGYRF